MAEIAVCASIGGREEQQDRVAAWQFGGAALVALADGMGGHDAGAAAAQAVIDTACALFEEHPALGGRELLPMICRSAHARINNLGAERGIDPHSTCVLLHLADDAATWAHVGDSRLYRFAGEKVVERTIDHSVVELLRLRGKISEEDMKTHPDQNRLYEALGGHVEPEVAMGSAALAENSGFALASDGLWEHIEQEELEAVLKAKDMDAAASALVDAAKRRGGDSCDNISLAAARLGRARLSAAGRVRRALRGWRRR